jgi:hypothetical protein
MMGQMTGRTDLRDLSVSPVHNALVFYLKNVWFLFLVFKKKLFFSNNRWSPPPPRPPARPPWSFAFPTPVL